MKEQPQRPEPLDHKKEIYDRSKGLVSYERYLYGRNIRCDDYISHLESENTALKERVAELERKLDIHKPGAWNAPEVK
ncbi:MAG: hypothetical protein CMF59_16710 [Leptospiraceae bacterium]|nr:hypothetical protein [Leptospiraceae bacterium]